MKNLGENIMQGWAKPLRQVAFWAVVACGWASVSANAVTLEDIGFTSMPGNEFEIQLSFSGQPPEPQAYTIEEPARIVLDFPGVDSALEEKKHSLSFENAREAVVLSAGGKTRLIVSLNRSAGYSTTVSGNTLSLRVGGAEQGQPAVAASQSGSTASVSGRALRDVDFSRGEEGEGLVMLDLSDRNISTDVSQAGNRIVAKLFNTALPSELDRRLDVLDFATPVKSIDTRMDGSTTVITIEAVGDYDYLAYQADQQFVISVKPLTPMEIEEKKAKFAFVGEKLSLNFQDIEVRSVLQLIADFTDLNLVASDTVTGNITLRLENVPWDQALDIVLKAKGLDKRMEGNVLLVAPAAEIAERERLQVEANKQLEELAPLVTEFVRIRYADAKQLFDLFNVRRREGETGTADEDEFATRSILSERGSAIVDPRTNTIILTDTEEKIAQFRRLVEQIDIPVRQVEISARIVVATTDFKKELGVKWGIAAVRNPGDDLFEVTGSRAGLDSEPGSPGEFFGGTGSLDLGESLAVDLGVSDSAGPSGSLALGFMTNNTFLDLELSALENSGYGEIASQPKVLTGDKQTAVIRSGQEIAYQEATSSGATNVEFKEAVLKLEVTPQITPDNRVILDLFIAQDSISDTTFGGEPALDITDIKTQALIGDGQTLVLGGIFQYQDVKSTEKVPLLGDIPVVGNLFKNRFNSSEKREILIFVTPKIIDDHLLDR